MNIVKNSQLNVLADSLINEIKNRRDIFSTIHVVFPTRVMSDWLKAYWLKNQEDVLMNVSFDSLDDIILKQLECDIDFSPITVDNLKMIIIKIIAEKHDQLGLPNEIINYLFKDSVLDPVKLYDFSSEMAKLFIEYDLDLFEPTGWEKTLYDVIKAEFQSLKLGTIKQIFDMRKSIRSVDEKIYLFGFVNYRNAYLKILDELSKVNDISMYRLELSNDYSKEYSLTTAPSKLRELEVVHGQICDLLKDKTVKCSDILVVAPNIGDYDVEIKRVFKQDDVNFPSIPYSISSRQKDDTDVTTGVKRLIEITNKGFFTRLDFFKLVSNPIIKVTRNITDDDIEKWMDSIIQLGVYRNFNNSDDWDYARKRILLSKVSNINNEDDNLVVLQGDDYLPYSTIGLDDESIIKFVNAIDDIKSWLSLTESITTITNDNVLKIEEELGKWFVSSPNNIVKEYRKVKKIMNIWKSLDVDNAEISIRVLFFSIVDSARMNTKKCGFPFTSGITFADFDMNYVMSAKHIFFLGVSSSNLPVINVQSELDLRDPSSIDTLAQQQDAFMMNYQNCDAFHISFVNRDLKSDEEFYQSTFIIELAKLTKNNFKTTDIQVDENRPWADLYTRREYKNKNYFYGLLTKGVDSSPKVTDAQYQFEYRKKISLSNIAEYLEEPLKFKAGYLFGRNDETDSNIRKEYEPFELDKLSLSILSAKLMRFIAEKGTTDLTDEDIEPIFDRLTLEHKLLQVSDTIGKNYFAEMLEKDKNDFNEMQATIGDEYEIVDLEDLSMQDDNNQWILTCNKPAIRSIDSEGNRIYFEVREFKEGSNIKIHYSMFIYAFALMDVASLKDNITYHIILMRNPRSKGGVYEFDINSTRAEELLRKIYYAINDYSDCRYIPIDWKAADLPTYFKLVGSVFDENRSPWGFFAYRPLFNVEKQLGYDSDEFDNATFPLAQNDLIDLIEFLPPNKVGEDENDE